MFKNMNVGRKIGVGFGIVLALLLIVGGIAFFAISSASSGFKQYREWARDANLTGVVQSNLLMARMNVKDYLQTKSQKDIDEFNGYAQKTDRLLQDAKGDIHNPQRAQILNEVVSDFEKYQNGQKEMVRLMERRFEITNTILDVQGPLMENTLSDIMLSAEQDRDVRAGFIAAVAQKHLLLARLYMTKFLDANKTAHVTRVREEFQKMQNNLNKLDKELQNRQRRAYLQKVITSKESYLKGFDELVSTINKRNDIIANTLDKLGPVFAKNIDNIKLSIQADQDELGPKLQQSNLISMILTGVISLIAIIAGIFIAMYVTRQIVSPINRLTKVAEEISEGNLSRNIDTSQNDEIGVLAKSFDRIRTALQQLISETKQLSQDAVNGNLSTRGNLSKFRGEYKEVIRGVNDTLDAVITPLNTTASYISRIASGDIPEKITAQYRGDFNDIKTNLNQCIDTLNNLLDDMKNMYEQHNLGDIDIVMPIDKYQGAYKVMAQGVNDMVNGHIAVKKKAMACVQEFGDGNFDAPLESFPGKKAFINKTIEQVRTNLKALIRDANMLAEQAIAGNLDVRADASKHGGDFKRIISGVNSMMDALVIPINNTLDIMKKAANKDLTVRINGDFRGAFLELKDNVNLAIENLEFALQKVTAGVTQVSSAAEQIAIGSQSLAEGSNEQASSLEEISSSLEEMSSMTKTNANNAVQAKSLAEDSNKSSQEGGLAMDKMTTAMDKIKESSNQTAKIVKTIDEIAMQTNLLALNAAVEAARAGEAGRGFAVVAEEVRNLAQRSAEAAKNTADMILEAVNNAEDGVSIASEVAMALESIQTGSSKVNNLISEIASASEEQSRGINQINTAVAQMDKVTQQNAANAEESASSSEELSSQSNELQSMVDEFVLNKSTHKPLVHSTPQSKVVKPAPIKQTQMATHGSIDDDFIPMDHDDLSEF